MTNNVSQGCQFTYTANTASSSPKPTKLSEAANTVSLKRQNDPLSKTSAPKKVALDQDIRVQEIAIEGLTFRPKPKPPVLPPISQVNSPPRETPASINPKNLPPIFIPGESVNISVPIPASNQKANPNSQILQQTLYQSPTVLTGPSIKRQPVPMPAKMKITGPINTPIVTGPMTTPPNQLANMPMPTTPKATIPKAITPQSTPSKNPPTNRPSEKNPETITTAVPIKPEGWPLVPICKQANLIQIPQEQFLKNIQIVKEAFEQGKLLNLLLTTNLMNETDEFGKTLLHAFVSTPTVENVEICKVLFEAGANIRLIDKFGYSAFKLSAGMIKTQPWFQNISSLQFMNKGSLIQASSYLHKSNYAMNEKMGLLQSGKKQILNEPWFTDCGCGRSSEKETLLAQLENNTQICPYEDCQKPFTLLRPNKLLKQANEVAKKQIERTFPIACSNPRLLMAYTIDAYSMSDLKILFEKKEFPEDRCLEQKFLTIFKIMNSTDPILRKEEKLEAFGKIILNSIQLLKDKLLYERAPDNNITAWSTILSGWTEIMKNYNDDVANSFVTHLIETLNIAKPIFENQLPLTQTKYEMIYFISDALIQILKDLDKFHSDFNIGMKFTAFNHAIFFAAVKTNILNDENTQLIEYYLNKNIDLKYVNSVGETALSLASEETKKMPLFRELVQKQGLLIK